MTGTAAVLDRSDERLLDEILGRAGRPDFDRWADQVERCGYCSRPVRLRGVVQRADGSKYSTDTEPDRILLIRCGNRRASVCPSCSYEYAGDMWQLLHAGAAGGRKGVPQSVRMHPLVFATLTAPSFGAVHGTRTGTGSSRCRPPRGRAIVCPHGRPTWCTRVHTDDDPRLGEPLCTDCYDYAGHSAFNWWAPELWRRFTITLRRQLSRRSGLSSTEFSRRCRVSFVKVAEFQRRGVVHFHGLIRLDGADDFTPPTVGLGIVDLADAIRDAAAAVQLAIELPDGPACLSFGSQTDTQAVNGDAGGELSAERARRVHRQVRHKVGRGLRARRPSAHGPGVGRRWRQHARSPARTDLLAARRARGVRRHPAMDSHGRLPRALRLEESALLDHARRHPSGTSDLSSSAGRGAGPTARARSGRRGHHPRRRSLGVRRPRLPHGRRHRAGPICCRQSTRATPCRPRPPLCRD